MQGISALLGWRVWELECAHDFSLWQSSVVLWRRCQGALLAVPASNSFAPHEVSGNQKPQTGAVRAFRFLLEGGEGVWTPPYLLWTAPKLSISMYLYLGFSSFWREYLELIICGGFFWQNSSLFGHLDLFCFNGVIKASSHGECVMFIFYIRRFSVCLYLYMCLQ